jgi:hypothetical protein
MTGTAQEKVNAGHSKAQRLPVHTAIHSAPGV